MSQCRVNRLLRYTPGTLEPAQQNPKNRFAMQHALVHYASGSVFTFIPKNACTSLRTSLAMANGMIASASQMAWIHKNNTTFCADLPDLARAPGTAVIIRCPFRRLVSAYLDKIVWRAPAFWVLLRKSHDTIDPDRLTFREFVGWLSKPGFLTLDVHWRPQVDFLVYDTYDRVFGIHEMAAFGAFFEENTSAVFVDTRSISTHTTSDLVSGEGDFNADMPLIDLAVKKSKGRLSNIKDMFDEDLIKQVRQLFRADFNFYHDTIGMDGLLFPNKKKVQS
jgi:hypothetical protein